MPRAKPGTPVDVRQPLSDLPDSGYVFRTGWKLAVPAVHPCSHCSQPKRPHRICPNCGYYDGEEIVASKA